MQTEARSWKILLREARAEVPVIVNAMTQEIFPAPTSRNCCPQRIAATALRNLLAYQIRLIVQHYSADDWNEYPEELSAFLDQVRCWLRTMKNPELFIGPRILPVTAQETEMIFHAAETFPVPSKLSLPRIRYAWAMAKRIMNTKKNSGNLFRKLYELTSFLLEIRKVRKTLPCQGILLYSAGGGYTRLAYQSSRVLRERPTIRSLY